MFMKKTWCSLLLLGILLSMLVLPASAASPSAIPQSPRDDVIILFDGSIDNVELQHPTPVQCEWFEDDKFYIQGDRSLYVRTADEGISFIGNFGLMLKITTEDIVSVQDYPISELSYYNGTKTKKLDCIQINYVDPENSAGAGDDSYNKNFAVEDQEPGWYRLSHVVEESALPGWTLNPDNIDHIRLAWTTDVEDYVPIEWNFDCLIIAKQSFYDDRTAAETEMEGIIEALEVPTAETIDTLGESILAAQAKLNSNLEEFPNFMVSEAARTKMETVLSEYQKILAQDKADAIAEKITALGAVTLDNYAAQLEAIAAIDAEVDAFVKEGNKKDMISNYSVLEQAKVDCARYQVEAAIDALPTVEDVKLEDEAKVNEVKASLEGLAADQQQLIAQEKRDKIPALLEQIEKLKHPYTLGDVDNNEAINPTDALMALQHTVQLITLDDTQFLAADVDGSGEVNATDALEILQYTVDLRDHFSIEDKQ